MDLESKQAQFNAAMELYNHRRIYSFFGKGVSILNISLQACLVYLVLPLSIGPARQILSLMAACLVADFINGLVHMAMDNNGNYNSIAGPLIASFHLHHKTPLYKKRNVLLVYFLESGSKIWLVGYLTGAAFLISNLSLHPVVSYTLAYIGILSSVAEVSHYLCHNPNSRTKTVLERLGLLLSKSHHVRHHREDNRNYAFLNGLTDPLINLIAKRFFKGYKTTTDLHYARYSGPETANRS